MVATQATVSSTTATHVRRSPSLAQGDGGYQGSTLRPMLRGTTVRRALFARSAASLAVAVALLAHAAVASANHSSVERVSTGTVNGGFYGATFEGATADGARVFFETDEPLEAGDSDTCQDPPDPPFPDPPPRPCRDIYERFGGTTTRISTGPAGGNGASDATFRGSSADGAKVFFQTAESLVAGDTDTKLDVYERSGGTTTRISTGPAGGNGAFDATFAGASADGTRVFFYTTEPLAAGDTDTASDIYERAGGTTTRISTGPSGGNSNDSASFLGASTDGARVFFLTFEQLEAGDADLQYDIYERFGGATTRISTGPAGGNGAHSATFNGASADGTRVFFMTRESLLAEDTDTGCTNGGGCEDIYERSGGTLTRISIGLGGGNGSFPAVFDGASTDWTRVFFSTAEPLAAGDTDTRIDLYERSGGTTTRISTGPTGGNGDFTNFFRGASADGTRVLFYTYEPLDAGDTDSRLDLYERSGTTTARISTGPAGGNGPFDVSFARGASADGTRVFFSTAEPLAAGDTDTRLDIYERFNGTTTLISTGPAGGNGDFGASFSGASADGTRVFFETFESLVADDTNGALDVYAARVRTGYARPKGATPLRVPLVIAYKACDPGSANRTHGPPLAHPSCAPPVEQSDWVTTATADANGQATRFLGSVRFGTLVGDPATSADEADLKIAVQITDVRRRDDLTDYLGEVEANTVLRITDRFNANAPGGGGDPATMIDIPLPVAAQCSGTADPTIGSTCAIVTTFDALVPAAVKEGKRAIWEFGQVFVSDGGADGAVATHPNAVFARQGIFVP